MLRVVAEGERGVARQLRLARSQVSASTSAGTGMAIHCSRGFRRGMSPRRCAGRAGPGPPGLGGRHVGVAVGVGRAGVERVGEDVVHAMATKQAARPRPPGPGVQPLEDLADGHPLVDQPAVELRTSSASASSTRSRPGTRRAAARSGSRRGPGRRCTARPGPSAACRGGSARRARPARTRRRPPGSAAGAGRSGRRRSGAGGTPPRSRPGGTPRAAAPGRRSGGPAGRGSDGDDVESALADGVAQGVEAGPVEPAPL